jgi:hypothetical protein
MSQQVLFIRRHGPHWPGANPTLPDDRAKQLIAEQVCIPYTDEARAKVKELLGEQAPGVAPAESVTIPEGRKTQPSQASAPHVPPAKSDDKK